MTSGIYRAVEIRITGPVLGFMVPLQLLTSFCVLYFDLIQLYKYCFIWVRLKRQFSQINIQSLVPILKVFSFFVPFYRISLLK